MQPCDELRDLVLGNYEKEGAGKVLEVVKNTYSHQEGAIVVGTDPNEWFEGYDAILHFYEPFGSYQLEIMVKILKAYTEGSAGWTVDQGHGQAAERRETPNAPCLRLSPGGRCLGVRA